MQPRHNPLFSKGTEPALEILPSDLSLSVLSAKSYIDQSRESQIRHADIVLLPEENIQGTSIFAFPDGSSEVFRFLRENAIPDVQVEIAVADKDYTELARHFDFIVLPLLLLTYVVAPTAVGLLVEYLKKVTMGHEDETVVHSSLIISDASGTKELRYEGPAKDYARVVLPAIQHLHQEVNDSGRTPPRGNDPEESSTG